MTTETATTVTEQNLKFLQSQPGVTEKMVTGLVSGDLHLSARLCHQLARNVGWWNDLQTGKEIERDMGEAFMLIASEVNEAFEGWRRGIQDDHLPQRPMVEVELADTLIRIFDTAGGMGWELPEITNRYLPTRTSIGADFCNTLETVTDAHGFWKVNSPRGTVFSLAHTVYEVRGLATGLGLDITGAMIEKLAYNVNRADHKREARLAEGGKKC